MQDSQFLPDIIMSIIGITGVIITNCLWCSSIPCIYKALKEKKLGYLNPIFFPFMFLNGFSWVLYSIKLKINLYLFQNIGGLFLGIIYTAISFYLLMKQEKVKGLKKSFMVQTGLLSTMKKLILAVIIVAVVEVVLVFLIPFGMGINDLIGGVFAVLSLCIFYTSPISTIFDMIISKRSNDFSWLTVVSILINSVIWSFYGFALGDPFIFSPHVVGCVVSIIQIIFKVKYPQNKKDTQVELTSI